MRINSLKDQIAQLERAAQQKSRRDAEAQAAAWFTHAGVETLLEIIQMAFPTAFPDAVGFLRQQMAAYLPVGEHPDPDAYDNFWAKKRAATKHKTEGVNSDDDQKKETSRKGRRVHRRVPEDEMDIDTDVPVRNRSGSRMSVPAVGSSETGWPVAYRVVFSIRSSPQI
jgi:hypothetical protein